MIPRKRTETSIPQALTEFGAQFQIPEIQRVVPYGKGSINETFLVKTSGSPFILQQLRPAYDYGSLEDYEAITQCVDRAGIITPRIVPTKTGLLGTIKDNRLWRMTSFVPGVTLKRSPTSSQVKSAAALLGRWHEGLSTLDYDFHFKLPDFHDTPKKMMDLQAALTAT
ncbi:MAG: phosphotransferase enzyme family protein [Candidatus Levyibacteriota bacterium]